LHKVHKAKKNKKKAKLLTVRRKVKRLSIKIYIRRSGMSKTSRIGVSLCVLALAAVLISFTGCKQKGLKGAVVQIGHGWGAFDTETYQASSEAEEQQLGLRKKIQSDNGITIREVEVSGYGEYLQEVNNRIIAGNKEISAYILQPDWAYTLYKQGLLYPVSDSSVNITNTVPVQGEKTAYMEIMAKLFTFDGKQYAFAPGTAAGGWHGNGIYFNKRLLSEAGLDPNLPYDMQKNGTWTWDNFLTFAKQLTRDIDNDGIVDIYAGADNNSLGMFVISNYAEFVGRDDHGRFTNATNTPGFIEALQFYKKMIDEGVLNQTPEAAAWDWHCSAFFAGKVAFIMDAEWRKGQFGEMIDDWGFVFPPKGPRAADYRVGYTPSVHIVPAIFSPQEVDVILTAVDLWNIPISGGDDWKQGHYNFYRDRRAVDETLTMMGDPHYLVFLNEAMIPGLQIGDFAWAVRDMNDPSQLIETNSQYWDILISEANQ
jgi:ABC-type glycerol-3-phosphate transport system substrate-binding protein